MNYAKTVGYAGTWGAGLNGQNTIHVHDMADICLFIFKRALEGTADEGADGLCEYAISDGLTVCESMTIRRLCLHRSYSYLWRMDSKDGRRKHYGYSAICRAILIISIVFVQKGSRERARFQAYARRSR